MSPIEVMARALCWSNCMDPNLTLGGDGVNFLWHEYTHQAETALKALSQMEPTPGMVESGVEAAEICGNILMRKHVTYTFRAMLAAAVKESSAGST